jgi:hypothetical protein
MNVVETEDELVAVIPQPFGGWPAAPESWVKLGHRRRRLRTLRRRRAVGRALHPRAHASA